MNTANFDSQHSASIVDLPADDAWPIAGFTYIVIGTSNRFLIIVAIASNILIIFIQTSAKIALNVVRCYERFDGRRRRRQLGHVPLSKATPLYHKIWPA